MSWIFPSLGAVALAVIAEQIFGYPRPLYRRIGHPVEAMGALISWLDAVLNRPAAPVTENRLRGLVTAMAAVGLTLAATIPVACVLRAHSLGWIAEALIATSLIAQRSLRDHVKAVIEGLEWSLERGRIAVSMIVGRDPAQLDESGVARAALESLAENTSDGVVAPIFWFAVFGLPGIAVYKMINTADSMIGHRSDRYVHFGSAAARLDDLVNLPGSRLTGLLFALVSGRLAPTLRIMRRDAPKHQSPNAGWPEAALAGALGIRLGGPRAYDGNFVALPAMGEGRTRLDREDIRNGLRLYGWAMSLLAALTLILAWAA